MELEHKKEMLLYLTNSWEKMPKDINRNNFFNPSADNMIETISINQLPKLKIINDSKNDNFFNDIIGKNNINELTEPNFKKQTGGSILFDISNEKETEVINLLILSWEKKLLNANYKLCKKYYIINTILYKQNNEKNIKLETQLGGEAVWRNYYDKLIEYKKIYEIYSISYNILIVCSNSSFIR